MTSRYAPRETYNHPVLKCYRSEVVIPLSSDGEALRFRQVAHPLLANEGLTAQLLGDGQFDETSNQPGFMFTSAFSSEQITTTLSACRGVVGRLPYGCLSCPVTIQERPTATR